MQKLKSFEETPFVTKVVHKNGITILVNEFHALPVVSISSHVKSGYAQENDENAGISEVLARMFFRGTTTRAVGTIGKEIKALGGSLRNTVAYGHTTHELIVPAPQWKKALEIQSDAFLSPLLDPEDLKRAIELTLAGVRQNLEDPEKAAVQKLLEVGFQKCGPGRGPIGRDELLRSLSREKALEYFRRKYTAPNMILTVAGDVTASEVLTEAVKLYDKAAPGPVNPGQPARMEEPTRFHYGEQRAANRLPLILFGFPAPAVESLDYPGFEVLRMILGGSRSSLISEHLREQKRTIVSGSADLLSPSGIDYLLVRLEVEPKNIDRSEIGLLTELEILKREAPEEEDMERAFALLEREYWARLETVSGRTRMLAGFEALGDWKKMNQYLSRLRQVKPEDVRHLAEKYLSLDRCSLLECLPADVEARNLTPESAAKTFLELLPSTTVQILAEREKEIVPAVRMPESQSSFKFSEVRYPFQKASVLRGPELLIREDHTLPLIHLGFFYPGGRLQEKKENEGITALMLNLMLRGTKDKNFREICRQLGLYGAELLPVVDEDYFGIRLSVLSRNIEPVLEMLADLIQSPGFTEDEFTQQKALQFAGIRQEKLRMAHSPSQLLKSALFKGHPYALDAYGDEQTLATLALPAVKEWYSSTIHNKKPIVVIIGDTQGTNLAGFFVRRFSGSRFQDSKLPEGFPNPLDKRIRIEEKRGNGSSLVMLGFQAPPDGDEDSYALIVLRNLLAGEGGRISDQLVYSQGIASDFSLQYEAGARGGFLAALVATTPGNEEKALKALEGELNKLNEISITYREFRSAVNAAIGEYWISRQERFEQVSALVLNNLGGRGLEAVQDMVTRLQDVKQEDLPDLARRFFNPGKSVSVILQGSR